MAQCRQISLSGPSASAFSEDRDNFGVGGLRLAHMNLLLEDYVPEDSLYACLDRGGSCTSNLTHYRYFFTAFILMQRTFVSCS